MAIDILKTRHINRDKVDWPTLEAKAGAMLGDGEKPQDAFDAIHYLIVALGERHTQLIDADHWRAETTGQASGNVRPPPIMLPEGLLLSGNIGLIAEKSLMGSEDNNKAYIANARKALSRFAKAGVLHTSTCG